ncbi:MAG: RNA polymerase sigma factor [Leptospiraceae bacterium]|nr:RNA polymerase sigma factor [Leptospiraceae bacterium]
MAAEAVAFMQFEETVNKEKKGLIAFIRKRINSEEDAEDMVQDIFSKVFEGNLIESIEDMTAWLYRAARNKIVDFYRRRRHLASLDDVAEIARPVAGDALFWEKFEQALSELPEEQRQVFEQNELSGKTFREIAEQTGENINTLISRKRYAVMYLRARLNDLLEDIE